MNRKLCNEQINAATQENEETSRLSPCFLRQKMSRMREDRFPNTNPHMGLQGVSLSRLRSIAAYLPRIAKIDMGDYFGYLNQRLLLYRTSRPKSDRHLPTRFCALILYRTLSTWLGVFTPAGTLPRGPTSKIADSGWPGRKILERTWVAHTAILHMGFLTFLTFPQPYQTG
jgi:hypothetical protein